MFLVSGTGSDHVRAAGDGDGTVPTVGYQVADVSGTTARSTLAVTVG